MLLVTAMFPAPAPGQAEDVVITVYRIRTSYVPRGSKIIPPPLNKYLLHYICIRNTLCK
jgi:hypothetical protein